jgi:hypothetical membrane protein
MNSACAPATWWVGLAGVGAVTSLAVGVLGSLAAAPGFSPLLRYVSELANPWLSERAEWFGGGLVAGGACLVPFALGLPRLVPGRAGRIAGGLGLVAAVGMVLTGYFPLDRTVPHFGSAAVLFAAVILAGLLSAVGLRRQAAVSRRPAGARGFAIGIFALFGLQLAMTLLGLVVTVRALEHVELRSSAQVLQVLPRYQVLVVLGIPINPVAIMEWLFVALTGLLVLATSVVALTRGRRARPDAS